MIDEPPVECFHTGRPACQNGNKGGNHNPNPRPRVTQA